MLIANYSQYQISQKRTAVTHRHHFLRHYKSAPAVAAVPGGNWSSQSRRLIGYHEAGDPSVTIHSQVTTISRETQPLECISVFLYRQTVRHSYDCTNIKFYIR